MAIVITCIAPVNIAVIKYWGKRNEQLILPLNDSISATLNIDEINSKTTVMASPKFSQNRIWLNGKEEPINNPRLAVCIEEIQKRVKKELKDHQERLDWKIHICSENNFPTAAGLASSAAGYACLVYALAELYGLEGDLTQIARQGSGSACRSLFGGFVQWKKGEKSDGSDSFAEQIVPENYWPDINVLILVVNDSKKKVSSTMGMQRTVETSELLKYRISHCVPERLESMIKAIKTRNFETFAEITMKDSNQFHSVCLDTYPPAVYMNDISHAIADFVHRYNKSKSCTKLAYTFDAGPNACLFLKNDDVPEVLALIKHSFPPLSDKNFIRGLPVNLATIDQDILLTLGPYENGLIKYILHTKIGVGPQILHDEIHHLLTADGVPKNLHTTLV